MSGFLSDYFPTTNGKSYRLGMMESTLSTDKIILESSAATSNCWLFNIIIGCEDYEIGDHWSAYINSGDSDEIQIVDSSYLKQVPENIRFQKPVHILEGKKIRVDFYPNGRAAKEVMVDFDLVR